MSMADSGLLLPLDSCPGGAPRQRIVKIGLLFILGCGRKNLDAFHLAGGELADPIRPRPRSDGEP